MYYIRRPVSVLHLSLHNDKAEYFVTWAMQSLDSCCHTVSWLSSETQTEACWNTSDQGWSHRAWHTRLPPWTRSIYSFMAWSAESNLATSQPPTEGTWELKETKAPLISFMMVLRGSRWLILQPEPVMCSVSRQKWKRREKIGPGWLCCS